MAGTYLGKRWERCPVAEIRDDRQLAAVRALRRAAKLSPLSGWPEGYAAWVVQLWGELDEQEEARMASERQGDADE